MDSLITFHELKGIKTPDGLLLPIYRDWDMWHGYYIPKMMYASIMQPRTGKGVILHKERQAFITAISGDVMLGYSDGKSKNVKRIMLKRSCSNCCLIAKIRQGVAFSLNNNSFDCATVINLPEPAWKPSYEDTFKFSTWHDYFASAGIK